MLDRDYQIYLMETAKERHDVIAKRAMQIVKKYDDVIIDLAVQFWLEEAAKNGDYGLVMGINKEHFLEQSHNFREKYMKMAKEQYKMNSEFDPSKPVEYRDDNGRSYPARIIATNRIGVNPIVALIYGDSELENIMTFRLDGTTESKRRLVNVASRHAVWVNWDRSPTGSLNAFVYKTLEDADNDAGERIACTYHEITEGEGLGSVITESKAETLKPCPFCGGDNVKIFGPVGWHREYGVSHSCSTFYNGSGDFTVGAHSRADAVAAWNRRVETSVQARNEGIAAAKQALVEYWTPGEYNSLSEALDVLEALKTTEPTR